MPEFLRNENVLYYHPLDSLTEYTQSIDWAGSLDNFVTGIFGASGLRVTSPSAEININVTQALDYGNIVDAEHITVAFWSSGLFGDTSQARYVDGWFGRSTDADRHGLGLRRNSTGSYQPKMVVRINTTQNSIIIPSYPLDDGMHFVVLDATYETSGWRSRISIDGSGWQDLGVGGSTAVPALNTELQIDLYSSPAETFMIDEMITWFDHALFTDQELSNLYELGNTYSSTMNQYLSVFGIPVSSGLDCFVHGYQQISDNMTMYIPGQKETRAIGLFVGGTVQVSGEVDLYVSGTPPIASASIFMFITSPTPVSGDINLYIAGPLATSGYIDYFINGKTTAYGETDQYIYGYSSASGGIDLYVSGVPVISSGINLYMIGPLLSSGNMDDVILGHDTSSGTVALFTIGRHQDIDVFVAVAENNPSSSLDLFLHGVASGVSWVSYTNSSIAFFINDSGDNRAVDSNWTVFVQVADNATASGSEIWQSFVRCGNVVDDNCALYLNGHASGASPNGILVTASKSIYVDGLAWQDGDEGLLSNGYSATNVEVASFAQVHLGLNNTFDLSIYGSIDVVQDTSTFDLFVFGILDNAYGSGSFYAIGKQSIVDTSDLFVFGIQGLESGNLSMYLEVTSTGLFNQNSTLYVRGF